MKYSGLCSLNDSSSTISSDKRCHNSVQQGLNTHYTSQIVELILSASLVPFSVVLNHESLNLHCSRMLFNLTVSSVCGAAVLILFGAFCVLKVLTLRGSRTFKDNANNSEGYRPPTITAKGLRKRRRHRQRSIT